MRLKISKLISLLLSTIGNVINDKPDQDVIRLLCLSSKEALFKAWGESNRKNARVFFSDNTSLDILSDGNGGVFLQSMNPGQNSEDNILSHIIIRSISSDPRKRDSVFAYPITGHNGATSNIIYLKGSEGNYHILFTTKKDFSYYRGERQMVKQIKTIELL